MRRLLVQLLVLLRRIRWLLMLRYWGMLISVVGLLVLGWIVLLIRRLRRVRRSRVLGTNGRLDMYWRLRTRREVLLLLLLGKIQRRRW